MRLSDESIVGWGDKYYGQSPVPPLPAGLTVLQIADGEFTAVARYALSAATTPTGAGCGGAMPPVLTATPPALGQPMAFALVQGSPNASGFLYFGGPAAAPIAIGSGCTVYVDLATASPLLPISTTPLGAWSAGLAVPMVPGLAGIQIALQAALFGTPAPLGFDLSNGVLATIGY